MASIANSVNVTKQMKDETKKFSKNNEPLNNLDALKEVREMINNPKKYPRYNNRKDLRKALLSDD